MPTTIARLNVPYGERIGGGPLQHLRAIRAGRPIEVHDSGDNRFNPIHEDDIIAKVPGLLSVAGIPTTTVNLGGSEAVDIRQWCFALGEFAGGEPIFAETGQTIAGVRVDLSLMHRLVGPTGVDWRQGMRRLVDAHEGAVAC